jgi:hypothetical protein
VRGIASRTVRRARPWVCRDMPGILHAVAQPICIENAHPWSGWSGAWGVGERLWAVGDCTGVGGVHAHGRLPGADRHSRQPAPDRSTSGLTAARRFGTSRACRAATRPRRAGAARDPSETTTAAERCQPPEPSRLGPGTCRSGGRGFASLEQAREAGARWTGWLQTALAHQRIGADLGASDVSELSLYSARSGPRWATGRHASSERRARIDEIWVPLQRGELSGSPRLQRSCSERTPFRT